ncbi:MAG: DNA (cytosine-5-)-methyltransferase [Gemmatimonadaceae bacterium]
MHRDIFIVMVRFPLHATEPNPTGNEHRTAGLFAGIGGIELGLDQAGHSTEFLCELETAARAVLHAKFPGVENAPDVTRLREIPNSISLLTAGFPCQDLSQAGKTAGIEGQQSGLVSHVFRLLRKRRVPWVLLENVSFMLRLGRGGAMRLVIDELEALGYRWAYRVIDSRSFGLPQRRERVYLVACLPDAGDPRDVILSSDTGAPLPKETYRDFANGFYWTEGTRGLGWATDGVPTLKGGSTIGIASPPAIWMPDGRIVKPDIRDAERLQGFPAGWTESALSVARSGIRWKLVGNAVTVDAAKWIGTKLRHPATYDDSKDVGLEVDARWPDAAWALEPGQRFISRASRWPMQIQASSLANFLQFEPQLLSARATAGFLSRARMSTLRFPEGLLEALENHLEFIESLDLGRPTAAAV